MTDERVPRVVHRDDDLLVLDKPSGLPTTSPDGKGCLAAWARQHDPAAARMHASSRLDAEVTGLVTFARSERAIQQLLAARERGQYRRFYLGLAAHTPPAPRGEWRWSIGLDPADPRRRVALPADSPQGRPAWSRYQILSALERAALLLLRPETGRTHQLRVHAAHGGAPLLGDKHYGGPTRLVLANGRVLAARRVMLHCTKLVLPPIGSEHPLILEAAPPPDMQTLFAALGGDATWWAPQTWGNPE